jgi:hypothetical protein
VTLCVYALTTEAPRALRQRGLEGEPLRVVTISRVSAIVSELRHAPSATYDRLRRYDAAMHRLANRYAAILPVRFGTCLTRDELEVILRERQQSFRRALRHVRRRVQMTVRIVGAERQKRDHVDRARTGVEYLRRRAAEAAIPAFDPVRDAVRRWVRDERIETRDRIASVYHLIPRGAAEAYRGAAVRRASELGLRATISGPFPPYAFTEW